VGRVKLAELAQVAEVVAAVAVVVSLVYVGMEVRSNTFAIQGAAMQAIATTDAEALMTIAADGDLSEVVRVGNLNPMELTEAEAYRYHLYLRQFWLSFQNIFQQSKLGLVPGKHGPGMPKFWKTTLYARWRAVIPNRELTDFRSWPKAALRCA
jgi:hypothetical protein